MPTPNTNQTASAAPEVRQWKVKTWPNGDRCEALYINGQYVGETRRPISASLAAWLAAPEVRPIPANLAAWLAAPTREIK
jgi:hypothetical protein